MGTGYTRNDTGNNIADGNIINASDLDGEFDAVESAFNSSTGHTHDGTSAEGGPITKLGPVQDLVVSASAVTPKTDNTLDLGSSSLEFKDGFFDGTVNIDSLVADTADINGGSVDGVTIGTNSAVTDLRVDNIKVDGNTISSTDTNGNITLTPNGTGEVNLVDNDKLTFGAGSDLQIYHDGSNSYIEDTGTGNLRMKGATKVQLIADNNEDMLHAIAGGAVEIYYDNAKKLETTSSGIDVTGTAVTDGLTVAGNVSVDGGTIKLDGNYPTGTNNVALGNTALDSGSLTGGQNVAIGTQALTDNTSGAQNTAVGSKALDSNTTASNNTAVGYQTLLANTTGASNIAVGVNALKDNTTADNNTAVGNSALTCKYHRPGGFVQ
jgi:hypothetical protein